MTQGSDRRRPQGDGEHPAEGRQINVVYTINEPAAEGGYPALKEAGKEKGVLVVAVDGGCPGVKSVKDGRHRRDLAAISAADGRQGRRGDRRFRQDRQEARLSIDTGVKLITDHPVAGVPSINVEEGMKSAGVDFSRRLIA